MAIRFAEIKLRTIGLSLAISLVFAAAAFGGGVVRRNNNEIDFLSSVGLRIEPQSIIWAVRPGDLLSCHTAGSILRRVERARPGKVPLSLVVVGSEGDVAWGASLLRVERLHGQVRLVSEAAFRSAFGVQPTPTVFVLHRGQVKMRVRATDPESAEDSMRVVLETALQ